MPKSNDPTITNDEQHFCDSCEQWFHQRGLAAHRAACLKKEEQQLKDAIFEDKMQDLAAQKQVKGIIFVVDIRILQ